MDIRILNYRPDTFGNIVLSLIVQQLFEQTGVLDSGLSCRQAGETWHLPAMLLGRGGPVSQT